MAMARSSRANHSPPESARLTEAEFVGGLEEGYPSLRDNSVNGLRLEGSAEEAVVAHTPPELGSMSCLGPLRHPS